ncbi:MAG: hypothetical protein M1830_001202 [Pleopsidium flavum]|nr:MAG: hypothetical protein M1830_001202 [Pleopsidium flavum]
MTSASLQVEMDDLPPPPYTPRDTLTPTSSTGASPVPASLDTSAIESTNSNGPSHDYYAYEQVLPGTDTDRLEIEEPLPSYDAGSSPIPRGTLNLRGGDRIHVEEVEAGRHTSHNNRNTNQPGFPYGRASPFAPPHTAALHTVSITPTSSTSPGLRAPSPPLVYARDSLQPASYGLSALQRVIDLAKQLSERPTEQLARSIPPMFMPRQRRQCRPSAVRSTSSSSSTSMDDPLSGTDFRDLEDLDLTNLRISLANLMRDPRNKDEILRVVNQLRDDLHNRRDRSVLKQQVREFEIEVHANRKKVKAIRKEAKTAQKAENREKILEKRAEKRARKAGFDS